MDMSLLNVKRVDTDIRCCLDLLKIYHTIPGLERIQMHTYSKK